MNKVVPAHEQKNKTARTLKQHARKRRVQRPSAAVAIMLPKRSRALGATETSSGTCTSGSRVRRGTDVFNLRRHCSHIHEFPEEIAEQTSKHAFDQGRLSAAKCKAPSSFLCKTDGLPDCHPLWAVQPRSCVTRPWGLSAFSTSWCDLSVS